MVLHEDADLVAIDKPAGMPAHPLRVGETGTAANAIVAHFPECVSASPDTREGGLAHRLDTATSGVLIAARSRPVWEGLRRGSARTMREAISLRVGAARAEGRMASRLASLARAASSAPTEAGDNRCKRKHAVRSSGGDRDALLAGGLHAGRPLRFARTCGGRLSDRVL